MMNTIWKRAGVSAVHAVAGGHLRHSRLNMKLGFALLRDRRIGIWPKLLSLAIGGAGAALLIALEIAPESVLALILPGLGLALDFVADGLEAVTLPFLFASLVLPFVAPRGIVDEVMAERAAAVAPALPAPTTP
jgi:hypothetical protein